MTKEQLTELGISAEMADKVLEIYAGETEGLIPKEKIKEYEEQLKTANASLKERDKQLGDLKKEVGDNEELKGRITKLQEDNKKQQEAYEAQISSIKLNAAVDAALAKAGARNIKAAKALLNMDSISLGEKGEAIGLNEQLTELTKGEDTGFMFAPVGAQGFVPGAGSVEPEADVSKMNYTQMCAYLDKNPGAKL